MIGPTAPGLPAADGHTGPAPAEDPDLDKTPGAEQMAHSTTDARRTRAEGTDSATEAVTRTTR